MALTPKKPEKGNKEEEAQDKKDMEDRRENPYKWGLVPDSLKVAIDQKKEIVKQVAKAKKVISRNSLFKK